MIHLAFIAIIKIGQSSQLRLHRNITDYEPSLHFIVYASFISTIKCLLSILHSLNQLVHKIGKRWKYIAKLDEQPNSYSYQKRSANSATKTEEKTSHKIHLIDFRS